MFAGSLSLKNFPVERYGNQRALTGSIIKVIDEK